MYRLAKECLKGELIEKDTEHAIEWFTRSAERGNPYAQHMLGKLYLIGKEIPYDEEQAVYWLTRSANRTTSMLSTSWTIWKKIVRPLRCWQSPGCSIT